jgi:hypothetical protein
MGSQKMCSELRQRLSRKMRCDRGILQLRACSRKLSELNSYPICSLMASITFWLVSMGELTADYADANGRSTINGEARRRWTYYFRD